MRRVVAVGVLAGLVVGLSGCAALLVGAGAAGGYAVSRDSITNHFDLSQDHVYGVSRSVIKQIGLITVEDARHGRLQADVEGASITITITPVSEKTVKLKVKARKFLMPKFSVAEHVYNRILERL
jgi:hypothetical protein